MITKFYNNFIFVIFISIIIFIFYFNKKKCECVGFTKIEMFTFSVNTIAGSFNVFHEKNILVYIVNNTIHDLVYRSMTQPWAQNWKLIKYYDYNSLSGSISKYIRKSPLNHPNALWGVIDSISVNLSHNHSKLPNSIKISNYDCFGRLASQYMIENLHLYILDGKQFLELSNMQNSEEAVKKLKNNFLQKEWDYYSKYSHYCEKYLNKNKLETIFKK